MCTAGQRVSLTITGPGPSFFFHREASILEIHTCMYVKVPSEDGEGRRRTKDAGMSEFNGRTDGGREKQGKDGRRIDGTAVGHSGETEDAPPKPANFHFAIFLPFLPLSAFERINWGKEGIEGRKKGFPPPGT